MTRDYHPDSFHRHELINACYRVFLGRPPEDIDASERRLAVSSLDEILCEFLESQEFRAKGSGVIEDLQPYYYYSPPQIDVDATPAQLDALSERLQSQWQKLGKEEPFWSVLTHDEYKLENFDDRKRAEFYATGAANAELIDLFCKRNGSEVKRGTCVELGCGVGRVTKHLAAMFDKVIAIDISERNLAECEKMAAENGLTNIEMRLLHSPEELSTLPRFDFLFSVIVLQHDPPPVQKYILDLLFAKIGDGGGFLFQTQTHAPSYSFSIDGFLASSVGTMDMHCLPMNQILRLAEKHELSIREVLPDTCTGRLGSHTFFAVKERGSDPAALPRFATTGVGPTPRESLNASLRSDLEKAAPLVAAAVVPRAPAAASKRTAIRLASPETRSQPPQSLWGKANSYLNSIKFLTRTRRQVEWLTEDVTSLGEDAAEDIARIHARANLIEQELERIKTALQHVVERQPAIEDSLRHAHLRHDHAHEALQAIEARLKGEVAAVSDLLRHERVSRQKSIGGLERRVSTFSYRARSNGTEEASAVAAPEDKASLNALLETFYFLLEERYRGSREEIKQRLTVYRKDFEAARARLGTSGPVIDIGCGRGELLELLREDGFQVLGIDQNDIQLEAAQRLGLPVLHHEARSYLAGLPDDSVLAVTGIHIVEHIPFPALVALMEEAARVLKKGGLVIFETPNPRNLIVGATTFHFDPTHIKPLPPEVLQILLETCGFTDIETRLLHPSDTLDGMVSEKRLDPHIAGLLFGPQDYAVLAIKS